MRSPKGWTVPVTVRVLSDPVSSNLLQQLLYCVSTAMALLDRLTRTTT